MKMFARAVSLACIAAVPVLAHAQFAKPQDAIRYRQAVMTVMGSHFGRLAPYARGDKPLDAADIQANVALVSAMAKLPWNAFGPGTQTDKVEDSIWSDSAKFKQAADRLQGDVAKLEAAAQSGDQAQLRTAYGAVAASCKACHDSFRKR
ncbi:cytochrome c [Pigmentiphaga soli]|uniref:Cytochrome c n=1 Tax=Pigmentiphaga soli TaxID=1007095 RepID=A0ABP8GC73_9BURK